MKLKIKDKVKAYFKNPDEVQWRELGLGIIGGFTYNKGDEPLFASIYFKNDDGQYNLISELIPISANSCKIEKW